MIPPIRIITELWRDPGEPRSIIWTFFVNSVLASNLVPARLRTLGYRAAGLDIALSALVRPGVTFRDKHVRIGSGSTINVGCVFDNRVPVTIGKRVGVSIGVRFVTSTHDMSDPACRAGAGDAQPIVVRDGAWLGVGATLLAGVEVGKGTVVGASALVTQSCEDYSLYLGVPAKMTRPLNKPIEPGSTSA